jgi:hypothetical protein
VSSIARVWLPWPSTWRPIAAAAASSSFPHRIRTTCSKRLEKGDLELPGFSARALFAAIHTGAMEGFFADPIYGGNRDMAGWKLVGFPGTRYDYRDVIDNPNKPYTQPPVSIAGGSDWDQTKK